MLDNCDKKYMFYCQHEKNVRHRLENDEVRSFYVVILITRSKVPDEKAQIFFRKSSHSVCIMITQGSNCFLGDKVLLHISVLFDKIVLF